MSSGKNCRSRNFDKQSDIQGCLQRNKSTMPWAKVSDLQVG